MTEDGRIKMKRSIYKADVNEYSTEVPANDVDTFKEEEVEYQSGKLQWSSGNTSFHLDNSSVNDKSDLNSFSLAQAFAASGSYSLYLESCGVMNRYTFGVQKKRIVSEMKRSEEEDLKATVDKSKLHITVIWLDNNKLYY